MHILIRVVNRQFSSSALAPKPTLFYLLSQWISVQTRSDFLLLVIQITHQIFKISLQLCPSSGFQVSTADHNSFHQQSHGLFPIENRVSNRMCSSESAGSQQDLHIMLHHKLGRQHNARISLSHCYLKSSYTHGENNQNVPRTFPFQYLSKQTYCQSLVARGVVLIPVLRNGCPQ